MKEVEELSPVHPQTGGLQPVTSPKLAPGEPKPETGGLQPVTEKES